MFCSSKIFTALACVLFFARDARASSPSEVGWSAWVHVSPFCANEFAAGVACFAVAFAGAGLP